MAAPHTGGTTATQDASGAEHVRMPMAEEAGLWNSSIDELVALYRAIERRHLSLPVFSITPLLLFTWNWIKFSLSLSCSICFFSSQ